METKALKTSWKQRIVIMIIAILMLGSVTLTYILIVLNGTGGSSSSSNNAKLVKLQEDYVAKSDEIAAAAVPLSDKYFSDFVKYKSEIKAYNSAAANADGLKTKDLKVGSGRTLTEGDTDYSAYYIGWCADGSIFDSSFDNSENPTRLKAPLNAEIGLVEGWNQGVIGMNLGGVRQVSMSGSLAYKDANEVCGGQPDTPLRFVIFTLETDPNLKKLNEELDQIYAEMYYIYATSSANKAGEF